MSMRRVFSALILIAFTAFFGTASAQTITITSPNGGENLDGCIAHTIAWTATGTSTSFSIDYSIDNGNNWTSVASFFNSTNGTFSWTVPNVTSSNCLVRVYDSNAPATVDVSDAVFSINGPLTLLVPNGGENWVAGTTQTISWAASGTSNQYRLEYSTDNGATWTTIVNNYNGSSGTYAWLIPNVASSTAIVRITDINNAPCTSDKSDAVFNLISEIDVTSPNGGETWVSAAGANGGNFTMNNTPVTLSTGNFYDSGGATGNYAGYDNFTKTFTPSNPEHKLQVLFTEFETYNTNDKLYIYNGPSTSDPLIGTYDNTDNIPLITSTHKTGALTFRFISNTYQGDKGWKALFTSIGPGVQTLSWNYTGTSGVYDLEYSTNSGLSWTRIISEYPSATGTFQWPVPNTASTTSRVRVLDHENNDIVDQSNADFTIGAAVPVFVVCTPNGGENVFPDETYAITWLSAFTVSASVMLEYSTDNGSTWTVITSSTLNDGTYDWTPPNDPSNQALVRVSEVGAPANNDVSDNVFNLRSYVTVTNPNGGQNYQGCDLHTITWLTGGTSDRFDIDFSSDGGTSWVPVVANYLQTGNSASYSWAVTNVTSTNCLVRIRDRNDTLKTDQSDATFAVTGTNYVILNQPNGGENWIAGNTYPITYTRNTSVVNNVNLQYSTNNGTSWSSIANNESSGVYSWMVPNINSTQALVKVISSNNTCIEDQSDATFNMVSEITLVKPNGGEVLKAVGGLNGGPYILMNNNDVTITTGNFFDSGGPTGNYNGYENFTKTFHPTSPKHKLSVTFTEFETYNSNDKLYIYNGPTTSDPLIGTYDNTDNIPKITSTHKTGALTFRFISNTYQGDKGWQALINSEGPQNSDVEWNIIGTSNDYHLEYSTNSGATWTRILSNVEATVGAYSWPVPNTPSTNARFRIIDSDNNNIVDQSAADFTIEAADPTYVVCEPNGGEHWFADETRNITWSTAFTSNSNVLIEVSLDNGSTWSTVATTFNDGQYEWLVPNTPSEIALVRISDPSNIAYADTSDNNFELHTYVEVTSPNGGESMTGCVNFPVSIEAGGTSGNYTVELSTDGGSTWDFLGSIVNNNNFFNYNWTVTNVSSPNCLIRVFDTNDPTKIDQSDAVFALNQSLNVQVGQPNGSETWVAGNTYPITYNLQGGVTSVRISYSLDSGATWTTIASNQNSGVYNWTVPNVDSDNSFIRVQDMTTPCNADLSNARFSIVSEVLVTAPNGGEVLPAVGGLNGGSYLIDNNAATITIGNFYDDGGANGNYGGYGNYTKTFKPVNPKHKLRVVFSEFETYNSNDKLYIYNGESISDPLVGTYDNTDNIPVITSTHKTGALTFRWISNTYQGDKGWKAHIYSLGADNTDIDWGITGTSNKYNIEYSTNSGVTWTRILTEVPETNPGLLEWPVPNTPTTQGRVRIVDAGNNAILDQSDADFTITTAIPVYAICDPAQNVTWSAGDTESITWASAFTTNAFVNIDYSLDSGVTWQSVVVNTLNDGTHDWIIPNTPSDEAMIRVSDATNVAYADTSHKFTLAPYIKLINPNGGQNLTGCNNYNISWAAGSTSGQFTVQLSTDGGSTWSLIANVSSAASTVNYNWTVTNVNSTNCLIRVFDTNDPSKSDQSDNVFTLNQTLNVQVFQPNGGETWVAGSTYPITYNIQGGVTSVGIYYSLDSGATWNLIVNNQSSGVYNWTVPNVDSDQALIRVRDVSTPCNADESNAVLSLVSEINVVDPNGGDTLIASGGPNGGSYTMNNTPVTLTTCNFYDDGGPNGNYAGYGNYTKTFTPFNPTHKLSVTFYEFETYNSNDKLYIYNGPTTSDPLVGTYQNTDNIPKITSTHKTGALTFRFVSNTYQGDKGWKAYLNSEGTDNSDVNFGLIGTSNNFHYEYSTNSGASWNRILSDVPATVGYYSWPVPNAATSTGRFRVVDAGNNAILDESDTDFVIQSPDPLYVICAPVAGEDWYAGRTETVEWASAFTTNSYVNIEYSVDSGVTWLPIQMNTINDGNENWVIPDNPSETAFVRVTDAANSSYAGVSSQFELHSYIDIIAPNGGQTFIGCNSTNITWGAGLNSGSYLIELSSDGGSTWTNVANVSNSNENVSYNWTVSNVNSTNCLIRVTDTNNPSRTDVSDAPFTIQPTLNVQLGQPNGGEFWIAGNTYPITYTLQGGVTSVRLEYSLNNGLSWTTIATSQNTGLYNWTIPNFDSDLALVRARDMVNACNYDISAGNFSMVSEIQVLNPNGGDTLKAISGPTATFFTMNSTPVVVSQGNFYDDGGPTGNYGGYGNYTKTFHPYNPTHKLQVQFTEFETYNSNDNLYIYNGPDINSPLIGSYQNNANIPVITSTHKTGALTFRFVSNTYQGDKGWAAVINSITPDSYLIDWNIIGTSGSYELEYSTNGGLNWSTIVRDYPSVNGQFPWAIPNLPTTQGKIRVKDAQNNTILDESDTDFIIEAADPVIVICQPNGGEYWFAWDVDSILWEDAFVMAATVTLEYSTDNGATWTLITSNTANDGSYPWTVPNDPSDMALVRITENGGSNYSKESDNVFDIRPHVTVTNPNGGENILGCSVRSLTWEAGGTTNTYNIDLSSDGGSTWIPIASNVNNSNNFASYNWTVNNVNSTNCLVRVYDIADPTKGDTSDAPFTITPTFDVQLLSPNGGEFWVAGTSQSILYNLQGSSSAVRIDYSTNGGSSWSQIISNTSGGAYSWNIPNIPTNQALIRVRDVSNACKEDISNAVFNIVSDIAITSPNGGEVWTGRVGTPGGVYLMNNTSVTLNTGNFFDSGGENGNYSTYETYTKTFSPDIATNKLQVAFTEYSMGSGENLRVYNGPTTASPLIGNYGSGTSLPPTLTSTHPTGALTFYFTSNFNTVSSGWEAYFNSMSPTAPENITWSITGTSGSFNIDYSIDDGVTWTNIVQEFVSNVGLWPWQVPNTPTTTARVRVTDANNGNVVDISDNSFEISPAIPLLLSPNGGETAFSGIPYKVQWAAPTFLSANVQLEYSTNGGVTWNLIEAFTFNDGEYDWIPPQTLTPFYSCLLRVSESGNTIKNDISDAVFTLSPALRITTPNSNTGNFRGCTQSTIDWVAGASTNYTIKLSIDSGATWSTVETNYVNSNSVVNYPWSIPNTPSENCLVRVTDNNNPSRTDVSDSVFTITPTIKISFPNFGGQIQAGSTVNLQWNSVVVSNFYDIDYSTDGGATWVNIVTNHFTTTDSYMWTVPGTVGSNNKIRVRDNLENCKEDISDFPFTIQAAAPSITLTAPTGNDTLQGCSSYPITWTELITSNFYNIEYSLDGGSSWTTIISNHFTTSGSYTWNVPNVVSNDALIRITDAADPAKTDVTNSAFVIEQSVTASITASGATSICVGDTVFLTSSSATGNVWGPFGQTTQTIAVTQSGSYLVSVTSAGCVATSLPVQVTVNSLPATPTISANGPTTICAGDQLILTSSSPSGNNWTPTGQTTQAISVGTSGNYQVVVSNQAGCSAASNIIPVTVNPLPAMPTAGSNSPVSLGGSINLTASTIAGAVYSWTGPNGFTSNVQNPSIPNADPSMNGTYEVTATVGGCASAPGSVNVTVSTTSGIVNLSGRAESELGSPIRSTNFYLSGTGADTLMTGLNGEWDFDVAINQSYTVTPEKNNDTITNNGVTTLDLILMRRHILNVDTLSSPYKILAADVNFSNSVSTLDLILTRTVILQTNLTFPNGELWNFVSSDFTFANPISPWPYENFRSYPSAVAAFDQDFIGIKLGDVNNTWDPNTARVPWAGEIPVNMKDIQAAPGEEIILPIRVADFKQMSGYQFTLEWDQMALDFLEVIPGELTGDFGDSRIIDGKLATSWDEPSGAAVTLADGSTLFSVRFRVKGDLDSESLVYFSNSMVRSEAYTSDLKVKTFRTLPARVSVLEQASGAESVVSDGYALSQNIPNPFSETTQLNFRLPIETEVAFVIYDLSGKEVKQFRDLYSAGEHKLVWDGTDESNGMISGGVYYIRMVTEEFTATRKMILIRN